MSQVIVVAPIEGGWVVQRGTSEPWSFASGARAEWSARRLAEALAEGGEAAEILIYLKTGELAGRILRPPAPAFAVVGQERQPEPA